MHSIVRGTGTPKDRASYILFEYIDPTEVGVDINLAEVELRKPRNLFVCVSADREDGERGEREGGHTGTISVVRYTWDTQQSRRVCRQIACG